MKITKETGRYSNAGASAPTLCLSVDMAAITGSSGALGGRKNTSSDSVSSGGSPTSLAPKHNAALQGTPHGALAHSTGLQDSVSGPRSTVGRRDAEVIGSSAIVHIGSAANVSSSTSVGRREGAFQVLAAPGGDSASVVTPFAGSGLASTGGGNTASKARGSLPVPPVGGAIPLEISTVHPPAAGIHSDGFNASPAGPFILQPPASGVLATVATVPGIMSMPISSPDIDGRHLFQNPIYTQGNLGLLLDLGTPMRPTLHAVASGSFLGLPQHQVKRRMKEATRDFDAYFHLIKMQRWQIWQSKLLHMYSSKRLLMVEGLEELCRCRTV